MSFIKQANFITTGFVGTPYLLDALTEIGRLDKAYTLLLREEYPSWLYSVNQGATTIWEHWDGLREDGYVRYNFTVPEGTVATVKIGEKIEELGAGKYTRCSK
jgi:hypothetical protein